MNTFTIQAPGVYELAADYRRACAIAQKHINRGPCYVAITHWFGETPRTSVNVETYPIRHDWGEALATDIAPRIFLDA
jgi:hypothetical protein